MTAAPTFTLADLAKGFPVVAPSRRTPISALAAALRGAQHILTAEAVALVTKHTFTPWPAEEGTSAGWLTNAVRWQDQDVLGSAHALPQVIRPFDRYIVNACYSMLLPGAKIAPHRGATNQVLRLHFPLVADPNGMCQIEMDLPKVGIVSHRWRPGRAIAFDDTHEHWAENLGDCPRIIVLVDVLRIAAQRLP